MFELRKAVVVLASVVGWLAIGFCMMTAGVSLVTLRSQSIGATLLVFGACAFAFWSFYGAYKKSRRAGNVSIHDLYENLGYRFCLTPLAVCAFIFVLSAAAAP